MLIEVFGAKRIYQMKNFDQNKEQRAPEMVNMWLNIKHNFSHLDLKR